MRTVDNTKPRLKEWASKLTHEQLQDIVVKLTIFAIDSEEVSFWDDAVNPYWSGDGEPLIEGQILYED